MDAMPDPLFRACLDPFDTTGMAGMIAVEGAGASAAKGIAADAGRQDPDPDWLPL